MYVYRTWREKGPDGHVAHIYTSGFYSPDGIWNAEDDHATREEAAARVHYMNGGNIKACHAYNELLSELLKVLKIVTDELDEYNTEDGGCDHSVGICICKPINAVLEARELIKKIEGDK